MSDTGWMNKSRCRDYDPELFHPTASAVMKLAVRVCQECPVIQQCLQYALAHMNDTGDDPASRAIGAHGVWGGTTPPERFRMVDRPLARYAG